MDTAFPAHPMVPTPFAITRVSRELPGTFTWEFDLSAHPEGFRFLPGQFNMLYAFGVGEVPISISGDPSRPDELVHTIRAAGTVTKVMAKLKKGDTIGLRGPFGSAWPMDEARGKDLLLIAGGLGLAPLRPAILEALRRRDDYNRVFLFYGARSPEDILYPKELKRWRGRFDTTVELTVDRASTRWHGDVGVVTQLIRQANFDPANSLAMICGPEIMMRFCVRELGRRGMPHEAMYVSMERNMKCGVGMCGHCQFGPGFVCKDGPVYRFDKIERIFYLREI